MKSGFVITAYKQLDLCNNTINMIRKDYGALRNSPIVIITTSEEDIGFKKLENINDNIFVIEYKDAPPYEPINYLGRNHYGVNLSKRILISLQIGIEKLSELHTDVILHLHSDTYWQSDKIDFLVNYLKDVHENKLLFSGDLSVLDLNSPVSNDIHFEPEGLIINVNEATKYGFTKFENIWAGEFNTHNFGSIEAMIGQFAVWCLSKQTILSKDPLPSIYREKVKIRSMRECHGVFDDGLVNQNIIQRDVF